MAVIGAIQLINQPDNLIIGKSKPEKYLRGDLLRGSARLGALRSDPPTPGHAIALAIKKGIPTEVAIDRQIPT